MKNDKNSVAGNKRHFREAKLPLQPLPVIRKTAVTIGDPGGIGPEIIIKALNSPEICAGSNEFLLIGNKTLLCNKASELGLGFPENVEILDIPSDLSKLVIGKPTAEGGKHSFLALEKACELAKKGKISAIVTAPLSKEAINIAGYHYSGQTEILEEYLRESLEPENKLQAEMLFVAENLRVMLLTRHVKVNSICSELSTEGIIKTVLALNNSLIKDFKLKEPKIAICGLNPHAGENGLLGDEENNLIKPALDKLKNDYGVFIEGPFPADALWAKVAKIYSKGEILPYDAYIACYHDQGLIPVKMLAPEKAVNTTINLPLIRTSPSHGTAYDIAGKNTADSQSMTEAINLAILLGRN